MVINELIDQFVVTLFAEADIIPEIQHIHYYPNEEFLEISNILFFNNSKKAKACFAEPKIKSIFAAMGISENTINNHLINERFNIHINWHRLVTLFSQAVTLEFLLNPYWRLNVSWHPRLENVLDFSIKTSAEEEGLPLMNVVRSEVPKGTAYLDSIGIPPKVISDKKTDDFVLLGADLKKISQFNFQNLIESLVQKRQTISEMRAIEVEGIVTDGDKFLKTCNYQNESSLPIKVVSAISSCNLDLKLMLEFFSDLTIDIKRFTKIDVIHLNFTGSEKIELFLKRANAHFPTIVFTKVNDFIVRTSHYGVYYFGDLFRKRQVETLFDEMMKPEKVMPVEIVVEIARYIQPTFFYRNVEQLKSSAVVTPSHKMH